MLEHYHGSLQCLSLGARQNNKLEEMDSLDALSDHFPDLHSLHSYINPHRPHLRNLFDCERLLFALLREITEPPARRGGFQAKNFDHAE